MLYSNVSALQFMLSSFNFAQMLFETFVQVFFFLEVAAAV